MSGVNVITFYSNTILQQDLGYSPILSRVISSCLQTWQFFAATSAIFLIDRIGRRRLLIGGAALMAIANAGLAGLQSHKDDATAAGCSLIFYFLALAAFPIGLFLIPFMYSAEIAPLRVRAQTTAMSSGLNWLFNFLVAEVTPVAFDSIGWKYYLVRCLYRAENDDESLEADFQSGLRLHQLAIGGRLLPLRSRDQRQDTGRHRRHLPGFTECS